MGVILGTDLDELSSRLAAMPAGQPVSLALVTDQPVSQATLDGITANAEKAGIKLLSPAIYASIDWEGYTRSAIYLSFVNPGTRASGEYGFWPMLIAGVIGVSILGYMVWKAGEIAESSITKNLPWIALVLVGGFLGYQAMKENRSER